MFALGVLITGYKSPTATSTSTSTLNLTGHWKEVQNKTMHLTVTAVNGFGTHHSTVVDSASYAIDAILASDNGSVSGSGTFTFVDTTGWRRNGGYQLGNSYGGVYYDTYTLNFSGEENYPSLSLDLTDGVTLIKLSGQYLSSDSVLLVVQGLVAPDWLNPFYIDMIRK